MTMSDELRVCADEARDWLFGAAAPLWGERGHSGDGLFVEKLTHQGTPARAALRLRVQARQIYAFCEIGRLGWTGPWRILVERGVDRLLEAGRRTDGFFIHKVDEDGRPADTRADLYDHAFILFALAHAERALKRPNLMPEAHKLMDCIDARWKSPAGGYTEGEVTSSPPRRQNPHMHLYEASLALYGIAHQERWKHVADTLFALLCNAFIDRKTGALREYFAPDWQPIDDDSALIVEPGHCFEWSWLLERDPANTAAHEIAGRLTAFARAHGIDHKRGVAINEVRLNGSVKDPSARLWPQTERLKAALARWLRTGDTAEAHEAVLAYRGLEKYFQTPVRGLWRDRLLADGTFFEEDAPASSFYHIVCALSELILAARR